jgi:nitrite reductase/ring-hydroxylating ferredoxin subunit
MSEAGILIELCAVEDVDVGTALKVEVDDLVLAVFNLDGEFHVTDDTCTHGPGSLSEGCIEGSNVICDFHDGAFDIRTGEPTVPPCMIPLKTYTTVIESGKVCIRL